MAEQNNKIPEEIKPAKVPPANLAMTRRGFDPQTIEEAWRFAAALAGSSLVPASYQGKPGDCIIALDLAARLDAPWLAIMQHVYPVHGRPTMDSTLSRALVNRSGIFIDPIEYEVEGDDVANEGYRVRAYAMRAKTGKMLYGPWITWKLVKAEGWLNKDGSKWKTMPDQMFHYRAGDWFTRRYCPEVTLGMLTTQEAEELSEEPKHVESQEVSQQLGVNGLKARLKSQQPPSTINGKTSGVPQDAINPPVPAQPIPPAEATPSPHTEAKAALLPGWECIHCDCEFTSADEFTTIDDKGSAIKKCPCCGGSKIRAY